MGRTPTVLISTQGGVERGSYGRPAEYYVSHMERDAQTGTAAGKDLLGSIEKRHSDDQVLRANANYSRSPIKTDPNCDKRGSVKDFKHGIGVKNIRYYEDPKMVEQTTAVRPAAAQQRIVDPVTRKWQGELQGEEDDDVLARGEKSNEEDEHMTGSCAWELVGNVDEHSASAVPRTREDPLELCSTRGGGLEALYNDVRRRAEETHAASPRGADARGQTSFAAIVKDEGTASKCKLQAWAKHEAAEDIEEALLSGEKKIAESLAIQVDALGDLDIFIPPRKTDESTLEDALRRIQSASRAALAWQLYHKWRQAAMRLSAWARGICLRTAMATTRNILDVMTVEQLKAEMARFGMSSAGMFERLEFVKAIRAARAPCLAYDNAAAATVTETSAAAPFLGRRVMVVGTNREDLDGKQGLAKGFDAPRNRYHVVLCGKDFHVKQSNLVQADESGFTNPSYMVVSENFGEWTIVVFTRRVDAEKHYRALPFFFACVLFQRERLVAPRDEGSEQLPLEWTKLDEDSEPVPLDVAGEVLASLPPGRWSAVHGYGYGAWHTRVAIQGIVASTRTAWTLEPNCCPPVARDDDQSLFSYMIIVDNYGEWTIMIFTRLADAEQHYRGLTRFAPSVLFGREKMIRGEVEQKKSDGASEAENGASEAEIGASEALALFEGDDVIGAKSLLRDLQRRHPNDHNVEWAYACVFGHPPESPTQNVKRRPVVGKMLAAVPPGRWSVKRKYWGSRIASLVQEHKRLPHA